MNDILQLFSIAGKINLDGAKEAERDLDSVESKGQGTASRLGGAAKKIGKAGLAIGAAITAAAAAAGTAMVKYGNFADELLDLSAITGLSTDEMQRWRQLAIDAGVDTNVVADSLSNLNRQIERGNEVSPRLAKGFDAMGMSVDEFKSLEADEQMRSIVGQMLEMEDADRRAFANQMNMADMLPLIAEMESQGKDLDEILEEIDVPFDEDDLNSMNEFRQTWDNFKQTIFEVLGQALMPLFDWFNDNMPMIEEIVQTSFEVIGEVLSLFYGWIETAIDWLTGFRESGDEVFPAIWETIQENLTMVLEFWQEVWSTIREFWEETGEELLEFAILYFGQIWETVESIFLAIREIIEQIIGYIVPWLQDKLQVLQEFWEEHGETVMEAVTVMYETIREIIDILMQSVQRILEVAWGFIEAIFDTAIGIILGIVETFASLITGDFEGMKDGLISIIEALWEGIKSIFATAWDMISEPLGILFDNISEWFTGLKDSAVEWGRGMIDGFIDGIKGMAGNVAEAAKGIVDEAAGFLKFWSPAKKGEGRFIRHWGRNMVDGFLDGVKDEEREAGRAMENIVKRMNPGSIDVGLNTVPGRQGVSGIGSQTIVQTAQTAGTTDELLKQLIETVKANKDVYIDGERVTGVINDVNAVDSVVRGYMG